MDRIVVRGIDIHPVDPVDPVKKLFVPSWFKPKPCDLVSLRDE